MLIGILLILTWLILLLRYPAKALPVSLAAAAGLGIVAAIGEHPNPQLSVDVITELTIAIAAMKVDCSDNIFIQQDSCWYQPCAWLVDGLPAVLYPHRTTCQPSPRRLTAFAFRCRVRAPSDQAS